MKAEVQEGVLIKCVETMSDGLKVLTVDCLDYDAYVSLPELVRFDGRVFGLTGWNSDTCLAYYRDNVKWAAVERRWYGKSW
jgi:hypothetical protein